MPHRRKDAPRQMQHTLSAHAVPYRAIMSYGVDRLQMLDVAAGMGIWNGWLGFLFSFIPYLVKRQCPWHHAWRR